MKLNFTVLDSQSMFLVAGDHDGATCRGQYGNMEISVELSEFRSEICYLFVMDLVINIKFVSNFSKLVILMLLNIRYIREKIGLEVNV